jgi:bacteriocin-like protein
MKNLEINAVKNQGFNSAKLKEMNNDELQETNGGVAWWVAAGVGAVLADWKEFKKGFMEGTEGLK